MKIKFFSVILIAGWISPVLSSPPFTLKDAIETAKKQNENLRASELLKKSYELSLEKGDLELSPYLFANAGLMDDKKPPLQPAFQPIKTEGRSISLGVAKKFASGTSVKVEAIDQWARISLAPGAFFTFPTYWTPSLSIAFSQSLWKDAFGRLTHARRTRELETATLQKLGELLRAKQSLMNIEQAYWSHIYALEDQRLKKDSLNRAEKLAAWMKRRVANGLSDKNDLLQAKALVGARELQLITAEDERLATLKNLETLIGAPLSALEIKDDIVGENKLEIANEEIRLDALLARVEARLKSAISHEVRESLRPEFNLMGSIATNAQKNDFPSSLSALADRSLNTTMVGVELKMDLDFWSKNKVSRSTELEAQASSLKEIFSKRDSDQSKSELIRRYSELNRSIKSAQSLVQIQEEKARRERDRLERGRTVTFQVINFEQEQSESEALLIKLLIERRKLEATRQLFVTENFGE